MDKDKILKLLVGYRNSMTEFDEEEMDYLIALVNFDIRTKQLSDADVEYWKDCEVPEEKEPLEIFKRSAEYSKEMKQLLTDDLKTIGIKVLA